MPKTSSENGWQAQAGNKSGDTGSGVDPNFITHQDAPDWIHRLCWVPARRVRYLRFPQDSQDVPYIRIDSQLTSAPA